MDIPALRASTRRWFLKQCSLGVGQLALGTLLARGPRVRVEVEIVRDNALAIAGILVPDIGGPSVFPHQPEGTWVSAYSSAEWKSTRDKNLWRRGLYTFWRRTTPYPTFMTFDAPSREVVCTRRNRSNTPLQALALLNDPAFVEAAAGLARRLLREVPNTEARIERGFRLCVARRPRPELHGAVWWWIGLPVPRASG
jgi:hypothetical protein